MVRARWTVGGLMSPLQLQRLGHLQGLGRSRRRWTNDTRGITSRSLAPDADGRRTRASHEGPTVQRRLQRPLDPRTARHITPSPIQPRQPLRRHPQLQPLRQTLAHGRSRTQPSDTSTNPQCFPPWRASNTRLSGSSVFLKNLTSVPAKRSSRSRIARATSGSVRSPGDTGTQGDRLRRRKGFNLMGPEYGPDRTSTDRTKPVRAQNPGDSRENRIAPAAGQATPPSP